MTSADFATKMKEWSLKCPKENENPAAVFKWIKSIPIEKVFTIMESVIAEKTKKIALYEIEHFLKKERDEVKKTNLEIIQRQSTLFAKLGMCEMNIIELTHKIEEEKLCTQKS